jgi:hypothetical protein
MSLGHIPFHSWFRKHADLYWDPMKIPRSCMSASHLIRVVRYDVRCLTMQEKICRQTYRHIDTIQFEHPSIAENFINVSNLDMRIIGY